MQIEIIGNIPENQLSNEDLMELLNERISHMIDEDINASMATLLKKRDTLKKKKSSLAEIKRRMDDISGRYNREKQLSRVLTLVDKLKKEGAIRGNNRKIIQKHVQSLEVMDFFKLRDAEENLSLLLPDTFGGK